MAKKLNSHRGPLDRNRILQAAVEFADEHGVEALTMRKVAKQLGFGVMSLYNHVANKDDLLTGMSDVVAGEINLPVNATGNWQAAIRSCAASAHSILLKHPWAAHEWSCQLPGPERTRLLEWLLQVLTEARLAPELIFHGFQAVHAHIVGFTQQEISSQQMFGSEFDQRATEFLETMSSNFPHLANHARACMAKDDDADEFGTVLGLILDGIETANKNR